MNMADTTIMSSRKYKCPIETIAMRSSKNVQSRFIGSYIELLTSFGLTENLYEQLNKFDIWKSHHSMNNVPRILGNQITDTVERFV